MTTPSVGPTEGLPSSGAPQPVASKPPTGAVTAIVLADFQKIALRIGKIVEAADHPNADRLLVLQVEIGGEPPERRQVVAGIKAHYAAADLIGKSVVVVANLAPAMLRGVESQGMILAASDAQGLTLVTPERAIATGSTVK